MDNYGKIAVFGGSEEEGDARLCFLDIAILLEIINEKEKVSFSKINNLWSFLDIGLQLKVGSTVSQISDKEILIFGGFDISNTASRSFDIVNLETAKVESILPTANSIFPSARGYHQITKFGKILFLYGGKTTSGEILSDMWKLVVKTRSWQPMKSDNDNAFYLPRANFFFTKFLKEERPVIFGGQNRNGDFTNDLILVDFPVCLSDSVSASDFLCLPCNEGHILSKENKCTQCEQGSYHDISSADYTTSTCKLCPEKTYNEEIGAKGIHSCKLCGFGFYNGSLGKSDCTVCPKDQICLPGSKQPSKATYLLNKLNSFYLKEENYPDFISSNRQVKDNWKLSGYIIAFAFLLIILIVMFALSRILNKKISRLFIRCDFLPVTGGSTRKLNGGILSVIYAYINICLISIFVMRYLYYNELIEVIPISSSHGKALKSSFRINIDLVGYEYQCINSNQKIDESFYLCSSEISILKTDSSGKTKDFSENKLARCQITDENICRISILCNNCKAIENSDAITISMHNPEAYVQLFHWTFESVWGENMSYDYGYSKLDGIFLPDNDIKNNYLFGGLNSNSIDLLLTPILYSKKNDEVNLHGYRSTFRNYERGSVKSIINTFSEKEGVKLKFNFAFASNQYEINVWKQIAFLDFYAFILGMFAGLSFLTRMMKYAFEKMGVGNISEGDITSESFDDKELIEQQNNEHNLSQPV